jgi:hypothetical protein
MNSNNQNPYPKDSKVVFVTQFKHWRSGKIIKAEDYGLKAFPIGRKK